MSLDTDPFLPPGHPDRDPATGKRRGGGGFPVLLLLAFAPVVIAGSFFLIPLFPVSGTIAVGAELIAEAIYNGSGVDVGGSMRQFVMAIVAIIALIFAMPLESAAEARVPRYRQVRHWVRVVGLALMINDVGIPLFYVFSGNIRLMYGWGLSEGVTIVKLLRVALLMVVIHVVFRLFATRGSGLSLSRRLGAPNRWE